MQHCGIFHRWYVLLKTPLWHAILNYQLWIPLSDGSRIRQTTLFILKCEYFHSLWIVLWNFTTFRPLIYQKHWQDQEIPRPRFVRENCPCLRYVSLGPEQRSARWSARWHGCQATKVPEHRGTCGHPYTHQRSYQTCPDEPPLAASWTEDTIRATHPSVQGTKRTCAWVHCRPPTRIRANSITEVGRCPLANWAKDNHSVGSSSIQQGSSGLMELGMPTHFLYSSQYIGYQYHLIELIERRKILFISWQSVENSSF